MQPTHNPHQGHARHRLRPAQAPLYETKEGEKRTVVELEVDEIGPSLRYAYAKVNRTQRVNGRGGQPGAGWGNHGNTQQPGQSLPQDDPWATPPTSNDAGGWGNGSDSEPPF